MAPSAVTPPAETVSELVISGINRTVVDTAPSMTLKSSPSKLNELDANKLIFTRNLNPHSVPTPNSPEVWAQNVYGHSVAT